MVRGLLVGCLTILLSSPLWADIGTVGNPHAAKNDEKVAAQENPPAAQPDVNKSETAESPAATAEPQKKTIAEQMAPDDNRKPLIEIAFDKNYVSYTNSLRQGVVAVERAQPEGAIYSVVSYLPVVSPSSLTNQRQTERAEANLRSVVSALRELGVPGKRISVYIKRGTAEYDVIKIFIE